MIMASLLQYGGLYETNLTSKLISFGADGVSIFQEAKICVITQLKEKHAPFMLRVLHCIAHWTNLAIQIFSKLPLMSKIQVPL